MANDWRWLAIMWHVVLGTLLIAVGGSHVRQRVLGLLLALPVASVAILATVSGNPFNAAMFMILSALLLGSASRLPARRAAVLSRGWALVGFGLVAAGWLYPHFVVTRHWLAYAYASPFGLLPCPTLLVVTGVTLAIGGWRSGHWNAVLAVFGLLYGAIGLFRLDVVFDVWLLVGGVLLAIQMVAGPIAEPVHATRREHALRPHRLVRRAS